MKMREKRKVILPVTLAYRQSEFCIRVRSNGTFSWFQLEGGWLWGGGGGGGSWGGGGSGVFGRREG